MFIINNKSVKYRSVVDSFISAENPLRVSKAAFEDWLWKHHAYLDAGNHIRFDKDEDASYFMLKIELTGC